jgi:hypothetical protein
MAFSDFKTIFDVANSYQITLSKKDNLFVDAPVLDLSEEFMDDLSYSLGIKKPNPSEIAVSESLIFPLLRYVGKRHKHLIVWSREYDLKADDKLVGIPDYVFTYTPIEDVISNTMPVVCVAEAKVDNFTLAWGQTLAEMVACEKLYPQMTIYGFVSNGISWEFAELHQNLFIQDKKSYNITTHTDKLAGILHQILSKATQEAEKYLSKN